MVDDVMRSENETLEQRIQRVVREEVAIAPYDPAWPEAFRREKEHLLSRLPEDLVRRVEHFGSTAVPGLAAKPIVDVLVDVTDLEANRGRIAPVLVKTRRCRGPTGERQVEGRRGERSEA